MNYAFACISDFIFVNTQIRPADIILVPGGTSQKPMEEAARLYHQGLAPCILPSGRYNPDIPGFQSEWEYLRHTALSMGVPDKAILKEDEAANTFENAKFSLKLLQQKNIEVSRAILVCKAFHSRRALLTYQTIFPGNVDFDVASVVDESGISKDNWHLEERKIRVVMMEVVKIGRYFETEIEKLTKKKA